MDLEVLFVTLLFVGAFGSVLIGIPVAFALSGAALIMALIGYFIGFFDPSFLLAIPSRIFGTAMYNEVLTAVPLFILMGVVMERSRVAEDLLLSMAKLSRALPAGLAVSVTIVGVLLAASTGIVAATVIAMGLLSLPTMIKQGYKPSFAAGSICASGTLGQIIPPSIVLVFLGDQLSGAYQEAQRAIGNFAPEPVSVGDLFAGALIPGVGLALMYMLYQMAVGLFRPRYTPPLRRDDDEEPLSQLLLTFLPPVFLILAVLGSILMGAATPTEAAGVGALGGFLLAGRRLANDAQESADAPSPLLRLCGPVILCAILAVFTLVLLRSVADLRVTLDEITPANQVAIGLAFLASGLLATGAAAALYVLARANQLENVVNETMRVSALAFVILIGATIFSLIFRAFGGEEVVTSAMEQIPGGPLGALIPVNILVFLLGFFLDFIEIVFIIMPIVAPAVLQSDIDPVWFAVLIAINLQTSFLTPPFGFALFYLRSVAPPEVKTSDIYRGVVPFIGIQLTALALVFFFPGLATWLPSVLFG